MMPSDPPAWLSLGDPASARRVIVFPHAGGGASAYVRLGRHLAERGVAVTLVRYPGRESRLDEPLPRDIGELADAAARELGPVAAGAVDFFGHSMGALVAFEVAHRWRRQGRPARRLWLSGRRGPDVPLDAPPLHPLPDAEFIAAVHHRYGALPAVLRDSPELLELLLPALRSDFRNVETYQPVDRAPLDLPISVMRGAADPWLDETAAAAWARHTTSPVEEHVFPGGHFYLDEVLPRVAALIAGSGGLRTADESPGAPGS